MRESELNLIPVDIIEHEVFRDRVRFWIFLAIGCFIFLISMNIFIKVVNRSVFKDVTTLESAIEKLSREVTEFKQMDMKGKEMAGIKERLQYISQKGPMVEIFTAIDKAMNDNVTLTHLEAKYSYPYSARENSPIPTLSLPLKGRELKGGGGGEGNGEGGYFRSSPPAQTPKGQTLEGNIVIFQGTAGSNTDLASLLTQLSMQPLFKIVNLRYSRTGESEKGKRVAFEIECRL